MSTNNGITFPTKSALIIGGASGIGLTIALKASKECEKVTIIDRKPPVSELPTNITYRREDLLLTDFEWLNEYNDCDFLFYSAGFGRVTHFEQLEPKEIDHLFQVNTIACFKVLRHFMPRLLQPQPFRCGVMTSIAGRIASPLFCIYSATKAALFRGIEAINTELQMAGSSNRILEVSPGSLKGTSFNGGSTDLQQNDALADTIVRNMTEHKTLLIPDYEEVFKRVIDRYHDAPEEFARESYLYKTERNRLQNKPQLTVGYLSGTFDLFHIGHLNLIKRARQHCDYLVVGIHRDGSHKGKDVFIPFEERAEILKSLTYVDRVIESEREDSDVYIKGIVKYDKLFVGSDYKGTERFNRYEAYFADKGVEIVYFPYTATTSSSQLRKAITDR